MLFHNIDGALTENKRSWKVSEDTLLGEGHVINLLANKKQLMDALKGVHVENLIQNGCMK